MERLQNKSIYVVWYEDRFASGSDRDPASLVALFLDQHEAELYIQTHEGAIDVGSGKFDGLFLKEMPADELIKNGIAKESDVQKLLKLKPPARLLAHWEKGWI